MEATNTIFLFLFFVFVSFLLHGDPLSQRLLFRGPTESLQVHIHTMQSQAIKSTHTLCGQWQHFFSNCSGVQGWV